eukprot:scaffold30696_cov71-Cyclotella_meneghiniana.AAC.1
MVLTNEAISQISGIQKLAAIKEANGGSFNLPNKHKDQGTVLNRISQLIGIEEGRIVVNTPQWMQKREVVEYMKNVLKLPYTRRIREAGTVTYEMRLEHARDYQRERARIQNMAVADAARNEQSSVDSVTTFSEYILKAIESLVVGRDNEGKAIFETDAGKVKHHDWRVLAHVSSLSPDGMEKTNGELKLLPWNSLSQESLAFANRPHEKADDTDDHTHWTWATANPETAVKFWVGHKDNNRHIRQLIRDGTNIKRIEKSDGSVVYTIKLFTYFIFPSNRNGDYGRHRQFRYDGTNISPRHNLMVQIKGAALVCACTEEEYEFYSSKDNYDNTNPTDVELFDYMKADRANKYLPEKAINSTILFLDGDSSKRLNLPIDHVGFRINNKGVYSAGEPIEFEDDRKPSARSSLSPAEDAPSVQPNAAAVRDVVMIPQVNSPSANEARVMIRQADAPSADEEQVMIPQADEEQVMIPQADEEQVMIPQAEQFMLPRINSPSANEAQFMITGVHSRSSESDPVNTVKKLKLAQAKTTGKPLRGNSIKTKKVRKHMKGQSEMTRFFA